VNELLLVSGLMRAMSILARTADLGAHGQSIGTILALGATAIERGDAGRVELKALKAQVEAMLSEGRQPTNAEFEALRARSDAAHEVIQGDTEGGDAPA
jgi:HAMP domain-containing protein